jgi:predicted transcriptional regulator
MSATTIKLDGEILSELRSLIKATGGTLTSLVRELLESEIRRRKMILAAVQYAAFLAEAPGEAEDMDVWAAAPLERDPLPRPHNKRPRRR